jgi:peroxiredoxin
MTHRECLEYKLYGQFNFLYFLKMKKFLLVLTLLFCFTAQTLAKLPKGSTAPDFTLKEVNSGKEYKLSSFKDKVVVLEWHCATCSFTKRHSEEKTMIKLVKKYKDIVWLAIDSSGGDFATEAYTYYQWKQKYGITYPILSDLEGVVGKKYGARVTPHMVVINKGKIVYQGAIDDDVFGDKKISQRKNYVALALDSITKSGKLPKKFKQYNEAVGCGIKY